MSFLRNCWYVAAWSAEVGKEPLAQKIIGEHVVLYRDDNEAVIALGDTCPHRFAPLHKGKIFADQIECPYHGLRFDRTGQCSHNPFDAAGTPPKAGVPAYPVVERDRIVWIWMGAPEGADPELIPDYGWINDTADYTFTAFSQMTQAINYELVLDNLMDLTHGQFLHPTTLGNESMASGTTTTDASARQVWMRRLNSDGAAPKLFVVGGGADEGDRVDFWNDMRWDAPSSYYLQVGITPTGRSREEGVLIQSAHLLTPQDEGHIVYRYLLGRNFGMNNDELTQGIEAVVQLAFTQEDEPILTAVQDRMNGRNFWDLKPLVLETDRGAILVRRALDKLKRDESI